MEEGDEDWVGRFNLSFCGARDATQNWQSEFTEYLVGNGFVNGKSSPCNLHRPQRQFHSIVHGGDFATVGPIGALTWFEHVLDKRHECKHEMLGPEGEQTVKGLQ